MRFSHKDLRHVRTPLSSCPLRDGLKGYAGRFPMFSPAGHDATVEPPWPRQGCPVRVGAIRIVPDVFIEGLAPECHQV